jgi:hypothetical protein
MSYRIKPYGEEIVIPNTIGAASSLSEATSVRLVNPSTTNHIISIVETQDGPLVGSFTIRANSEVIIEKVTSHCIHVNSGSNVLGTKVGFTN